MSSEVQLLKRHAVHKGWREIPDRGVSQECGAVHDQRVDQKVILCLYKGKDQDYAGDFNDRIAQHDLLKLLKSLQEPCNIDGARHDLHEQDRVERLVLGPCHKPDKEQEDPRRSEHQNKAQYRQFPEDM